MSYTNIKCKNCENSFNSNFQFCPHCGQKSKEELTVGILFSNTIRNYFSVDARFFKSFIPLIFKPGYLTEKFIEGKRLLYLHPAQLYLFTSVVFFFIFSFKISKQERNLSAAIEKENVIKQVIDSLATIKNKDSIAVTNILEKLKENKIDIGIKDAEIKQLDSLLNSKANNSSDFLNFGEDKVDSLIRVAAPDSIIYKEMGLQKGDNFLTKKMHTQILKLRKNNGGIANILRSFYDTIPIAMFILLPIFALILKLLFYKRGPFAHHLVFTFYYYSFLYSTFIVLLLTDYIWPNFPGGIQFLIILSTFIYLFLAIKRFYKRGWILSFLKTGLATFIYFVFVIPIAIALIGLFAFMYY